jgi:hypothetical protein
MDWQYLISLCALLAAFSPVVACDAREGDPAILAGQAARDRPYISLVIYNFVYHFCLLFSFSY